MKITKTARMRTTAVGTTPPTIVAVSDSISVDKVVVVVGGGDEVGVGGGVGEGGG